jgi:hypothetical protein
MINLDNLPELKLSYHVQARNGYYGVDEYVNKDGERFEGCTRNINTFRTRKQANIICGALNDLAHEINKLRGLE